MKQIPIESSAIAESDMRAEYDFSGGVRGKYAKTLREKGYVIRVRHTDGTYTEKHVLGKETMRLTPMCKPTSPIPPQSIMLYAP